MAEGTVASEKIKKTGNELLIEAESKLEGKDIVDVTSLKQVESLVVGLEEKINENIRQRLKYPNEPAKFMDSEIDLHTQVEKLSSLATTPQFFHKLVEVDFINTISTLVQHENIDISVSAINFLQELVQVDEDTSDADIKGYSILVSNLCRKDLNAIEVIISNLIDRFEVIFNKSKLASSLELSDEAEVAANGIYRTLNFMENMINFNSVVIDYFVDRTNILDYFLSKIQRKNIENDQNVGFSAELLSVFCQSSSLACLSLKSLKIKLEQKINVFINSNGMDAVLVALSRFRKNDYTSLAEEEYGENLFEVLSSCLLYVENQSLFIELEGIQLLLTMIKHRKGPYPSALKILRFLTINNEHCCSNFVSVGGLKHIFTLFMAKGIKLKRKRNEYQKQKIDTASVEESVVGVIFNCLLNLTSDANKISKLRIYKKFVEDDFIKSERLVEILERFTAAYAKKKSQDSGMVSFDQMVKLEAAQSGLSEADAKYMVQLTLGLDIVEKICYIIGDLICYDQMFYFKFKTKLESISKGKKTWHNYFTIKAIGEVLSQMAKAMNDNTENGAVLAAEANTGNAKKKIEELATILIHEEEWDTK